jgi:hypothetical protein
MEASMRITALAALAALAGAACSDSSPTPDIQGPAQVQGEGAEEASPSSTRWYDVTISNLTTGQPLSPGVVLTHSKNLSLFEAGAAASDGIRFIAESGDPSTAAAELSGVVGVADLETTSAPVGIVGGSAFPSSLTVRIWARGDANRLSLALMLICTNDGFTGLDGVQLPGGFDPVSWDTPAYDAGTEINTEADGDIVPPCFALTSTPGTGGGGHTDQGGVIALHPGILGGAVLVPSVHGWSGPIARITVQRVK